MLTFVCQSNEEDGSGNCCREGSRTEDFLFRLVSFTSYVAYVQCKSLEAEDGDGSGDRDVTNQPIKILEK